HSEGARRIEVERLRRCASAGDGANQPAQAHPRARAGAGKIDSDYWSYLGTLIRPSQKLLLFSSQEYSMIWVSVRSVKVRLLPQSSVKVLGSWMVTSYAMWPRSVRVKCSVISIW